MIAQTKVSMNRIQLFIQEEDQKKLATYPTSESPEVSIDIEVGEYAWTCDENLKSTIKIDERMIIMKGYKVAVCGSVGSGKSSLLCSILGEIPRISGQEVRDNVLFGKKINKAFYEDVLEACALDRDIQLWYNGDLSVVGERGMNLSGGQKQRIQLARAIYSESDVYFLDDPFSAVDAHTGAHLFQASNISCSSFSLFFFLVNTKTLKTWNPFAEMSYANLVSEDCHLCHPSAGVLGCFRPCSGKLLEL
ncbi:ABC transporter C family member 5 [Vitis vinifera]|uniref:ABC-type xenobiotic transporter n=1 Tax=Vitis vinifera TaxID=29760 RepID=A0A438I2E9_VITVI|nr:ABC transporter C family member 5 [Vitis vinifera]